MNETPIQEHSEFPAPAAAENRGGCGLIGLFVMVAIGVFVATVLYLSGQWFVEQAIFEGSLKFGDNRWIIALVFGLILTVAFAILRAAVPHPVYKRIYRMFLLAAIYCLTLTPVHLAGITSEQTANALQIGCSLAFIGGFLIWLRLRKGARGRFLGRPSAADMFLALAAALVGGYLWLAWGAFGSALDTALNLLAGLLLGAALTLIVKFGLFDFGNEELAPYRGSSFWFYGLAASLAIGMAAAAFGHNGSEQVLFLAVPWIGWVLAANLARSGGKGRLWPGMLLAGLTAAWPLMLVDPDELSVVINSGQGELIAVALRAAAGTIAIGVVLLIVTLVNPRRPKSWTAALAAAALVIGAGIYFIVGQPGFYGEKLFVIMKSQTDISQFAQIQPIDQRRGKIYHTMTADADRGQADLRAALQSRGIAYKPYYLVNALEVNGGPILRRWLEGRADVDRVLDSPYLRPLPDEPPVSTGNLTPAQRTTWNLSLIHADQVWNEFGVTGKGVVIGQSDSGADGTHPEIADSYRGSDSSNDYNWLDPWFQTTTPHDRNGHGTHTLGTMLGNTVGVAPDAQWIGCVNLGRNLGNPAVYLDCMQFMLAPYPQKGDPFKDGKPELGANVMNNSWGCPFVEGCDPGTYSEAVKALRAAGIFVVVSAGNTGLGGCNSVTDPLAIYPEVLSVGAIDASSQRASFSSMGPVSVDGSNRVKPDIMAPGVEVFSSFPGNTYEMSDGTSMAGPHLVGVVALMWSANPNLIGNVDLTTQILESTATRVNGQEYFCEKNGDYPTNETGYGIVNAYEAVKMAMQEK